MFDLLYTDSTITVHDNTTEDGTVLFFRYAASESEAHALRGQFNNAVEGIEKPLGPPLNDVDTAYDGIGVCPANEEGLFFTFLLVLSEFREQIAQRLNTAGFTLVQEQPHA